MLWDYKKISGCIMKNNKIYMTLAHLYNQIKGVVGDSGRNLSEEIDKIVKSNENSFRWDSCIVIKSPSECPYDRIKRQKQ